MRFVKPPRVLMILLIPLVAACSSTYWAEDADEDVEGVIEEKSADFEKFRESGLILPGGDVPEEEEEPDLDDVPRVVGLSDALRVATARNRDYVTQRDSLYIAALALTNTRNEFSPFFTGTISALMTGAETLGRNDTARINFGVRQILPTGGNIRVDVGGAKTGGDLNVWSDGNRSLDLGVTFDQPLLRDAGYESSHETLTQGERNVIYAVRDFELFREDFTINILTRFYNLVRQQQEILNSEQDLSRREFLKNQSEEKFKVGLATQVDMLRATREYLSAQSELLATKEAYNLSLDRFKIQLGLPTSFPLTILPEEPEYSDVPVDLRKAVEAALNNRVDLITTRDRVEDAERKLSISVNQLRPDLDFTGTYRANSGDTTTFRQVFLGDHQWTLGLTLELPLERTSERNAMRRRMLDLDQSRRDLTLAEDNVILQVRDSYRTIRRLETSLDIRKREVTAADREREGAQIRFDAGEMDNLALTAAQNAVLRANNSYIRDLVSYEVARVQLLRDVGILFLDDNGMWREP